MRKLIKDNSDSQNIILIIYQDITSNKWQLNPKHLLSKEMKEDLQLHKTFL